MDYKVSILCMSISAFIGLFLPILLAIYFHKKYSIHWKSILVGIFIFIVFQVLTRIPLLQYVQKTHWYSYNLVVNPWIIYIMAGLSAGVFEEVGRLIGFKYLLRNKQQWKSGIGYGIGHGGIEAILFCGAPFVIVIMNSLSTGVVPSQPAYLYLVGGAERIFAMTFHIAASLMVLYAVKEKKYRYFLYAILAHSILDSAIGFIKNIWLIELWAAVWALVVLIFIIYRIKKISNEKILF